VFKVTIDGQPPSVRGLVEEMGKGFIVQSQSVAT
jgi:hypothetical protein